MLHDKMVIIGKSTLSENQLSDDSITPKKGQLGFVDKVYVLHKVKKVSV